jgi:hypothetical protein
MRYITARHPSALSVLCHFDENAGWLLAGMRPPDVLSNSLSAVRGCPIPTQINSDMTRQTLTSNHFYRPEKKQLAGYGGLSGAGGAGRDSPIGDDDNDLVRRANSPCPLNLLLFNNLPAPLPKHPMHLSRSRYPSPPVLHMLSGNKNNHGLTEDEQLSENNDFCSACGGSGFLLCCDGCDRSFHFSCLDPPLNEDASELNEPWYCFICVAKRPVVAEQPEKPAQGLFAPLLNSLKKRNPSNFQLPDPIRNFYEGVHADKSGNYTETVTGKTR